MDSVEKHLRTQKNKLLAAVVALAIVMLMAMGLVIVFYEYRIRAVLGSISMAEKTDMSSIIRQMFSATMSAENIAAGENAMKEYGFTENGFSYLFNESGQWIVVLSVIGVFLAITLVSIMIIIRIGKNNMYDVVVNTFRDNEKLTRELKGNVEYLSKRNTQMQQFIENIAHQIKTPLAAINLALDAIKEKNTDNKLDNYVDQCFEHCERIKNFIKRLLNISRIEAGKIVFAMDCIGVSDVINQAIMALPSGSVRVAKIPDSDYTISGDEEWLSEALLAIIGNSCEYVSGISEGKVYVDTEYEEKYCTIRISDNGAGFGKQNTSTIFDRFETSGDEKSLHVGIGLNFAKLVIEAHHGKIYAKNSEKYSGAEFTITLPKYKLKEKK